MLKNIVKYGFASLVLSFFVASCNNSATSQSENDEATEEMVSQVDTVIIEGMEFVPAELIVNKGDKIVFINEDIVAHDVTEKESQSFQSPKLQPGDSWEMTAEESVDYFCSLHLIMEGKIIVNE